MFSRAAAKYKQDYGKVPVLIIDNANKISKEELNQIQDFAKLASDREIANVVFVTSDGHVPRHMMERSSWSRHGSILEISDASRKEALQYLKLLGIDSEKAIEIYELVGGRMVHLNLAAKEVKKKNKRVQGMYAVCKNDCVLQTAQFQVV